MTGERETASDTGPLITLEKLSDGYRFIRLLYDKILIPRTVLDELVQGQFLSAQVYLEHYGVEDLLEVVETRGDLEGPGVDLLDAGERLGRWPIGRLAAIRRRRSPLHSSGRPDRALTCPIPGR